MANGPIQDRSTTDLIIIFLTGIVGLVILGVLVFTSVVLWRDPHANVQGQIRFMTTAVSSLMTGVIGYIGGKASSNGVKPPQDGRVDVGEMLVIVGLLLATGLLLTL